MALSVVVCTSWISGSCGSAITWISWMPVSVGFWPSGVSWAFPSGLSSSRCFLRYQLDCADAAVMPVASAICFHVMCCLRHSAILLTISSHTAVLSSFLSVSFSFVIFILLSFLVVMIVRYQYVDDPDRILLFFLIWFWLGVPWEHLLAVTILVLRVLHQKPGYAFRVPG